MNPKELEKCLLTDDEMFKILGIEYYCDDLPMFCEVCKAQHTKTLKETEPLIRQDERERIFKEIEKHINLTEEGEQIIAIGEDSHLATRTYHWWQALKEGEGD